MGRGGRRAGGGQLAIHSCGAMRPRRSSPGDFWPENAHGAGASRGQGYIWGLVGRSVIQQIVRGASPLPSAFRARFPAGVIVRFNSPTLTFRCSPDEKPKPQMAGVTPSFQFQVPPASEDTKAPGLLASMAPGGFMDAQKEVRRPRWSLRRPEPAPGEHTHTL